MDRAAPLTSLDPRPISSPYVPYGPSSTGPAPAPTSTSVPNIGVFPPQIPDHPGSTNDIPRASNGYVPAPVATQNLPPRDIKTLKENTRADLRGYRDLSRQGLKDGSPVTMDRIRTQRGIVVDELRALQSEMKNIIKEAENSRWRRWLIGGAIATFIPLVRKIFRRGEDEESKDTSNDTEYAFRRSKSLLAIIKNNIMGKGSIASVGMFVFAVLFVFQTEVTIRVAKTMQRKLKKLSARIEAGDPEIEEKDLKLLDGWRWRVLL